jgi:hypothetical protein
MTLLGLDFLIMGKSIFYHLWVLAILLGETGIGVSGNRYGVCEIGERGIPCSGTG